MNRYQVSNPRKAFAAASIIMTVLTLGLSVIVPATMAPPRSHDVRIVAPIEVVARPTPIDVVAIPDTEFAATQVRTSLPKGKQEG